MSILLEAQRLDASTSLWLILSALWTLLALYLVIVRLRVLRAATILGPPRLEPHEPAWPLAVVFLLGFFVWVGIQDQYIAYQQMLLGRGPRHGQPLTLGPADNAFLSTVPDLLALGVLILGDVLPRGGLPVRLGYLPKRLGRGAVLGVVALFVALPFIFIVAQVQEFIMDRLQYAHPSEHELLHSLGQAAQPWVAVCLVAGATVAAPLFEEFFFRAHLQTLLRQALGRWTRPGPGLSPGSPPQRQESPFPAWAAVIITSLLFALIHPLWERAPIFVVSLCLGYVYERTGNLWAAVTTHLLFNSISTAAFIW
jgi:membrane protease YdiL (CAAX protease family)